MPKFLATKLIFPIFSQQIIFYIFWQHNFQFFTTNTCFFPIFGANFCQQNFQLKKKNYVLQFFFQKIIFSNFQQPNFQFFMTKTCFFPIFFQIIFSPNFTQQHLMSFQFFPIRLVNHSNLFFKKMVFLHFLVRNLVLSYFIATKLGFVEILGFVPSLKLLLQ